MKIKEVDSIVAVGILESSYGIKVLKYDEEKISHIISLLNTIKPSIEKLKMRAEENKTI